MLRVELRISEILPEAKKEKRGRKQNGVVGSVSNSYRLIPMEKETGDLEGIYACPGLINKPREMMLVLVTV